MVHQHSIQPKLLHTVYKTSQIVLFFLVLGIELRGLVHGKYVTTELDPQLRQNLLHSSPTYLPDQTT